MLKKPVIQIQDLQLQFGERKILNHINITINEGEFIAILGPNGAGKTTLLKLLLGLLKPTSGKIFVLSKKPQTGNNEIGYAPQHRVLETDLALRARDVVRFGLDGNKWGIGWPSTERTEKVNKALKEVNMLQLAEMPVGKLSGGEQQRLLIAQALLTNPKILLLDEPLSNLDITHARAIVELLAKISRSRTITILLVTHDINPLISTVDCVVYLANGNSAMGKPENVITSKKLSELYGSPIEVVNNKGRLFVIGEKI